MPEIKIPSSLTMQLDAYGQRLQAEAQVAADKAMKFLHDRVQEKARQQPGWSSLADAIEVWSQDGMLVVGVRDEEFKSQAFALEYGDEVRPPTPLFRSLTEDVREASDVYDEHMTSVFGYGRIADEQRSAES
jgi:hypothetical protein